MRIGVLALQGAFIEHIRMLNDLGAECVEIRQAKDFNNLDGLVLPGGESTVMLKLLHQLDLYQPIKDAIDAGLPTFGTCAGLILMAKSLEGSDMKTLSVMDIVAKRNAYGRQLGSFETKSEFSGIGEIDMVYIRAPYIVSVGNDVEVLSVVNDKITAARQNNLLATAFHPELTIDPSVHRYFLNMITNK